MRQHDGVVVRVDNPRVRSDVLNDLMQVRPCGNAGADVEELPYALRGQERRRAAHERAVGLDVTDMAGLTAMMASAALRSAA